MAICSFCENSCSEIEIQAYGRCSFCQKKYNTIPLSLEDYAKFTDTTAVYPNAGSGDNLELFYLTCGLTNEAGEVAGKIKKLFRDGRSSVTRDDIVSEFKGILNYGIIGLIQLDIDNDELEELEYEDVAKLYNEKAAIAKKLMQDKNHDYGEAWREMSQESFVDLILAKILRIKQILANKGHTIISEGIDANFYDIINYAVFALILMEEKVHGS